MTQPDYLGKPAPEADAPPPAPFDRPLSPADHARILRLWQAGHSAYRIGSLMQLRYARVERIVDAPAHAVRPGVTSEEQTT